MCIGCVTTGLLVAGVGLTVAKISNFIVSNKCPENKDNKEIKKQEIKVEEKPI